MRVSDAEIARLAHRLAVEDREFRAMYTRRLRDGDISLRETRDKACVFYDPAGGCRVYSDRPLQCRTWPFWRTVVHTPERWAEEARDCPGMNRGPRHDAEHIAGTAARDGTSAGRSS